MAYQRIKTFWINKINDLITAHNVQPDENDWQDQINNVKVWTNFETIGLRICRNIYGKTSQLVPSGNDIKGNNYGDLCGSSFKDLAADYFALNDKLTQINNELNVLKLDGSISNDDVGDLRVLKLGHVDIGAKLGVDINADFLPNDWATRLVNIQVLQDRENQIKQAIGLPAGTNIPDGWHTPTRTEYDKLRTLINGTPTGTLPVNWENQVLVNHTCPTATTCQQTHCPATHQDYNTRHNESNHYQRIHTKLNGKVSDNELQALLNAIPTCSHTDYDTIKNERDTLQTENTQLKEHECDCDTKVAQKEKEIITKIITDLSLSTERERENVLEAVITEIKGKITPPTDKGKDSKITELEQEITQLKAPKSLKDLPISQEVKEEVIKISQELGLTAQSCAKLESATSYQELSTLQQQAFQEKLNSEVDSRKSSDYLNYGLGVLTLGSLLILAWMLIKRTSFTPEIGGKKEKE